MMKIKSISTFTIIVILTSCQNNKMSFDMKNQRIISCSSKNLDHFTILNEDNLDVYEFTLAEHKDTNLNKINIGAIAKYFKIKKNMIAISARDFRLAPFSRYSIRRSGGDASGFKVAILTDSLGIVVKTSHPFCN